MVVERMSRGLARFAGAATRKGWLILFVGMIGAGCSTYREENKIVGPWDRGDIEAAKKEANRKAAKEADGKDRVIWRLEQGTVLRTAGEYLESNEAFSAAEQRIDYFGERADVSVSRETAATLSNQANLPYRGRDYDAIMLNTYRALNFMALGDLEAARVEMIRAYQRQQDAVANNRKRIEQAVQEERASKDAALVAKAKQNDGFKSQLSQTYSALDGMKAYADYVNPFTVFLDGLFFSAHGEDASDLERARKSFERAVEFAPDNDFLREDFAAMDRRFASGNLEPTTYVIFETGRAPIRGQERIDIPILISRVSYIGAAFPTMKVRGNHVYSLDVAHGGDTSSTKTVASMDRVIGGAFENELPIIITKTLIAAVAKGVAAYAINDAARKQDDALGLLAIIATAAYQMAVNVADTRTWTTLPKEFQYCRFPRPGDGVIELTTRTGGHRQTLILEDGLINVVYVRNITPSGPLFISQFRLK